MNISGVLVKAFPEHIETIEASLNKFDGVEVHGNNSDGRMVVTVERETSGTIADLLVEMQNIPGVLSASMIYHQFEDEQ